MRIEINVDGKQVFVSKKITVVDNKILVAYNDKQIIKLSADENYELVVIDFDKTLE